ncbi:MAG: hypothetical protein L0177_14265 [Chloroflexi bacterium]|nr:hypothetical protein [Chloroflexota bacterium]
MGLLLRILLLPFRLLALALRLVMLPFRALGFVARLGCLVSVLIVIGLVVWLVLVLT